MKQHSLFTKKMVELIVKVTLRAQKFSSMLFAFSVLYQSVYSHCSFYSRVHQNFGPLVSGKSAICFITQTDCLLELAFNFLLLPVFFLLVVHQKPTHSCFNFCQSKIRSKVYLFSQENQKRFEHLRRNVTDISKQIFISQKFICCLLAE